jgi:superfamily II DNA helicase RecQ
VAQYCRYCVHCIEGDVFFCTDEEKTMTESQIKRSNNCINFQLTEDILTGKEYKPREKQDTEQSNAAQMMLFGEE